MTPSVWHHNTHSHTLTHTHTHSHTLTLQSSGWSGWSDPSSHTHRNTHTETHTYLHKHTVKTFIAFLSFFYLPLSPPPSLSLSLSISLSLTHTHTHEVSVPKNRTSATLGTLGQCSSDSQLIMTACKYLMEYTLRGIHGLMYGVLTQLIFQKTVCSWD